MAEGKRFERVRIVDTPPTDGQRFLLASGLGNVAAGEDIRNLTRADAQRYGLPDFDFWLFDSRPLVRFVFDEQDTTLGVIVSEDPAEVLAACQARDTAWHHATRTVRARIRRQRALYEPGKRFRFLVWEGALYVRTCPREVHASQLDRLVSLIGLDTVELGIVPLGAQLRRTPSHGYWIYDQRLVIVETISTEMWLDDEDSIRLYERAWEWLAESAVYGHQAHRVIGRARASLCASARSGRTAGRACYACGKRLTSGAVYWDWARGRLGAHVLDTEVWACS